MNPPVIGVDHAKRAWATILTTLGVLTEFLQHAAPEIQKWYPDVKWIGPAITMLGFLWLSFQRVQDTNRQAKEL